MDYLLALPGALAIGLSLGLLGSGGSILTVPVLVYLLGQNEKVAIAGSLFIVGSIAAAGGLQFLRTGFIQWRSVLIFGLPGMLGTYLGAVIAAYVSVIGSKLARRLPQEKLKRWFGYFLIFMGLYILAAPHPRHWD